MKLAPALLGVALMLAGCDRQGPWTGFVHRREDAETYETLIGLKSFEECQERTIEYMRSLPEPDQATYVCSKSCRWDASMRTNICAEKRK